MQIPKCPISRQNHKRTPAKSDLHVLALLRGKPSSIIALQQLQRDQRRCDFLKQARKSFGAPNETLQAATIHGNRIDPQSSRMRCGRQAFTRGGGGPGAWRRWRVRERVCEWGSSFKEGCTRCEAPSLGWALRLLPIMFSVLKRRATYVWVFVYYFCSLQLLLHVQNWSRLLWCPSYCCEEEVVFFWGVGESFPPVGINTVGPP